MITSWFERTSPRKKREKNRACVMTSFPVQSKKLSASIKVGFFVGWFVRLILSADILGLSCTNFYC